MTVLRARGRDIPLATPVLMGVVNASPESFSDGGLYLDPAKMHPLQQAFYDNFAAQCGYYSAGMITVAKALLDHNPHPTREQIVAALSGNVCRCTGYVPIIEAIEQVANSK